ncbi:helix-turn-helix domain-containing protein [Neomoorella thermoacetica]|nr:helix-turn-helix domain-containing protein [Moorella thermoacetica]
MLKVSERTIRRWVQKGDLPALRYGRQLRIPASALEKLGRPAAEISNKRDWLAKCRAARAMMPLRGDRAVITTPEERLTPEQAEIAFEAVQAIPLKTISVPGQLRRAWELAV